MGGDKLLTTKRTSLVLEAGAAVTGEEVSGFLGSVPPDTVQAGGRLT